MKRFTDSEKTIGSYNWKAGKAFHNASLKDQCQRKYFYGTDLKMEHEFANIEGVIDDCFKLVDQFGVLRQRLSGDHDALLFWIALQSARTPYAADQVTEMMDQFTKATFADHPDMTPDMLKGFRVREA